MERPLPSALGAAFRYGGAGGNGESKLAQFKRAGALAKMFSKATHAVRIPRRGPCAHVIQCYGGGARTGVCVVAGGWKGTIILLWL